jgi:hypothetical protein
MAMLVLNAVFERNWGYRAGTRPVQEFWAEVIEQVSCTHPHFLFVAEAYWDLEWDLLQQGFHFCYDKCFYDRLVHETADTVRQHLLADLSYQERLVRFIENHDEHRVAAVLPSRRIRACAVASLTLPGAGLVHEGQFEGRRVRVPLQLGRRPAEPVDRELHSFYLALLKVLDQSHLRSGQWRLCQHVGWPDNSSYLNLIAWSWRRVEEWYLVVVNLSDFRSQGHIQIPWEETARLSWLLSEMLGSESYERNGEEMRHPGLYVDLNPWSFHLLKASPI